MTRLVLALFLLIGCYYALTEYSVPSQGNGPGGAGVSDVMATPKAVTGSAIGAAGGIAK